MMKKKAQAEDIFADFVIALIFIITTIILISCTESGEEAKLPYKVIQETAELYSTDILMMLKSDLSSYGYREMAFAELFAVIAEDEKEKYPWIFGEAAFVDDEECTEKFEMMMSDNFRFGWDIQLYNEDGGELFRCAPNGREPISHKAVFCRQKSIWLPLKDEGNARLEVAICP
ncbi:MAG: hypothetical protein KJ955_07060 [Nanoarchaeota archaeon]|nr:hypothetical protein [Nanoarchaeota archaeon]